MARAIAEVKQDLGRDAVILRTRSFRKGGLFGLGGRRMWEVTASQNVDAPPVWDDQYAAAPDALHEKKALLSVRPNDSAAATAAGSDRRLDGQIDEIRGMVEALLAMQRGRKPDDIPPKLRQFHQHLLRQDVAEDTASELIARLRMSLTAPELADPQAVLGKLAELTAARIRTVQPGADGTPGRARVVALIGPTGVGKTTTVAKLAANFKLRQGRRVGLITIDTYRIAAVDQLRTYAEIIDVPLRVVLSPPELNQAVHAMRRLDVVLIDTVGRSQNDELRLNRLRGFLAAANVDEMHLVVSATGNRTCTTATLERFAPLGADRIIVSKLDEAATFGLILNVAEAGRAPLSYVTTGQDVPDDIAEAAPDQLAELIVRGGMYVG